MNDLNSITSDCKIDLVSTQEPFSTDIISVAECKIYFDNQELTDEKALDMKNNLVGIVNSVINFYLEGFK